MAGSREIEEALARKRAQEEKSERIKDELGHLKMRERKKKKDVVTLQDLSLQAAVQH